MEAVTRFLHTAHQLATEHIDTKNRLYRDCNGDTVQVRRMKGLLPCLQHHFYPNYRPKKRKRGSSSSKKTGIRVDKEMEAFVAAGRRLACGYHPFSLKLVQAFHAHKLQLLATQVPLFDAQQHILTYIDAVGLDYSDDPQKPVPILIDFKTGYDVGYTSSCERMQPPFERVPDSPKNQHHLQLAWEVAVAGRPPYNTVFDKAFILLVNHSAKKVKKMDLPQWCNKKRRRLMLEKLCH